MLVDAAMGQYYPRFIGKDPDTPLNLLWMVHRAMSRWLYMRSPQAMANTQVPQWKSFAEDATISLNRTIKESDFGRTVGEVVDQSLYSVGALCMTADYVGTESGMKQKLILESVPCADLVWDADCRRLEQSDYIGRRIVQKLIDVREHPLYDPAVREKVRPSYLNFKPDEDKANWQSAQGWMRTSLYDYVELYQVLDRADSRIYVWPVEQPEVMLMGDEWNGPRDGFIRLLHYGTPPGHPWPVAPMQNYYGLADAQNILLVKALRQQQVSKGLLLYTAAQKEEAKQIIESMDLQSALQENGPVRWTHVGGASPDTVSMSELARRLFSYAVGNLDQMLGLGSQAPTFGQERMVAEATTANMRDMAEVVGVFLKNVVEDAYWFNIRNPESTGQIWKPIGRTGLSYPVPWTREKRQMIQEMKFEIDVEPYSYRGRTPDGRLADFLGALQVLGQYVPMMAAQGISFDMESIARTIATYKDLPELYDAMIMNQDPQELSRLLGPRPGDTPMNMLNKPQGRYVREDRNSGAGEMQELMRMFGRNGQAETAAA